MGTYLRGSHSRGPLLKGPRTQLVEALLSGGPLVRACLCMGPSFVGAPLFVGVLCSCTFCTCLNPALGRPGVGRPSGAFCMF
jgi:hypothetical protein